MHRSGYIGRKMRQPKLQEKPAIILAPFGSTSRGKDALDMISARVTSEFSDYKIYHAYTSAIIRKKQGLPSLHQVLSQAEEDGYRKVIVQPLHIFPGTEYQQIAETCEYFPGIRTFLSESLMHRWDYIRETLEVVEQEFLAPDEGLNLLALHGTPLAADPVNTVYLGLEKLVTDLYPNTLSASIEGVPDFDALIAKLKRTKIHHDYKRIRLIPMMYLAGVHVEDDIMGEEDSWKTVFESLGLDVDCPTIELNSSNYLKGLGFYPEIVDFFVDRLRRTTELARYY